MPGIQPPHDGDDFAGSGDFRGYAGFEGEDERRTRARKLARYAVPVAIASLVAATIGIGTALATTGGGPSLPDVTAQQLLAKMAGAKTDTVSGSIRVSTDLGLPSGLLDGALSSASGSSGSGGTSAADPQAQLTALLSGTHTLRVAADGPTRQRLTFDTAGASYTVVHNGSQLWAYDSAQHSVYHATGLPTGPQAAPATPPVTPADAATQVLKALGPTTAVTVDGTGEVAGRAVYELVLTPKQAGSTIGSVRVGVDAATGLPLSFSVLPAAGGDDIADIAWTEVDFSRPAVSQFTFSTPKGAHVTQAGPSVHRKARPHTAVPGVAGTGLAPGDGHASKVIGKGWTAVAELSVPKDVLNNKSSNGSLPSGLSGTLGKTVKGAFGSGTVISTRAVNVLITDDGGVYAGAVTPSALVKAADAAK